MSISGWKGFREAYDHQVRKLWIVNVHDMFAVSIDGGEPQVCSIKEPFRSEQWKRNVLRSQAIKDIPVTLYKKGKHRLTITALDHHVVVDQWMLDFNKERQFYVFPIEPNY